MAGGRASQNVPPRTATIPIVSSRMMANGICPATSTAPTRTAVTRSTAPNEAIVRGRVTAALVQPRANRDLAGRRPRVIAEICSI